MNTLNASGLDNIENTFIALPSVQTSSLLPASISIASIATSSSTSSITKINRIKWVISAFLFIGIGLFLYFFASKNSWIKNKMYQVMNKNYVQNGTLYIKKSSEDIMDELRL